MRKNIVTLFILLLCAAMAVGAFMPKQVSYAAYNLTEAEALVQYAWPHTNQLRRYREATAQEIAADEAKTEKELFDYNGKKYTIFGERKYSYFFVIVSNTGAYTEYETTSGGAPLYVKVARDGEGKKILDANGNDTYVSAETGETGAVIKFIAHFNNNYLNATDGEISENIVSNDWFNNIFNSLLGLVNAMFVPLIIIVASLGTIFIVMVSVRMARSETAEDRDKNKKHLISIIIAVAATVLLMLIAQLFGGNANTLMDYIRNLTS